MSNNFKIHARHGVMKSILVTTGLIIFMQISLHSQGIKARNDSIRRIWYHDLDSMWKNAPDDTSRVIILREYANYYKFDWPDSALYFATQGLNLARRSNYPRGEINVMGQMMLTFVALANEEKALQIGLLAIKIAEKNHLRHEEGVTLCLLGMVNSQFGNYNRSKTLFRLSKAIMDETRDTTFSSLQFAFLGETCLKIKELDSALYFTQLAIQLSPPVEADWVKGFAMLTEAKVYNKLQRPDKAIAIFNNSIILTTDGLSYHQAMIGIAESYRQMGQLDSSIHYAKESESTVRGPGVFLYSMTAKLFLADIYESTDPGLALSYTRKALADKDSMTSLSKATSLEYVTGFDQESRQYEIKAANTAYRNRIRQYLFIGSLAVFLLIAFILYRNNRQQQRTNKSLAGALTNLQTTQAQLIQSEKMASLGELTAGIAHEIQNPLNFVKNFSEVNNELLLELNEELEKGNLEGARKIAADINSNEEKIIYHGKRADNIVKGMLQHSRTGSGQMEEINLNNLLDEYLRLAYHGLRAKDNSFNVKLETDFDNRIGKVRLMPQEIGRVIVNLLNNAFYAIKERHKSAPQGYEPLLRMSTRKLEGKVEIIIKDNGMGIPSRLTQKIFQPFFTTKPTGTGTGLGLSLSYDIIKAHGGEISVKSKEMEGTEFIIQLPM